ncbi:unnamed protein product [Orchesella dallaii]|uniref:Uncharacterized protein n=1 Tax=Orchesella dallaii TaxID=48710 RepID=A0ABP1S0X3_9HEXA
MITKITRTIVKYRILIGVYLSGAADWTWNAKQECFVPTSIYLRWNVHLLQTLRTTFSFFMSAFLLSKLPSGEFMESTENFVIFILGWMEIFMVTVISLIGIQLNRHWRDMMYIMNQMSRYSDYIEELMRRHNTQFNREEQTYLDKRGKLIGIMAVVSIFVPFAFGACVCVMIEPIHAMLQEWLEVNISIQP